MCNIIIVHVVVFGENGVIVHEHYFGGCETSDLLFVCDNLVNVCVLCVQRKNWKKRLFILTNTTFGYYKTLEVGTCV